MNEKKKMSFGKKLLICMLCGLFIGGSAAGTIYGVRVLNSAANEAKQNNGISPTSQAIVSPTGAGTEVSVTDVSTLVSNVMPAMTIIECQVVETYSDMFGRTYGEEGTAAGSGIIIAQKNDILYVATNAHVVEGAKAIKVYFGDGTSVTATCKGSDTNADLAVLSIDLDSLSSATKSYIRIATLGSSKNLKAGDFVVAIGNALGTGESVTVGYISATERDVTIDEVTRTLLQTDAAINPGNSGGALINANGEVIGINSAKYSSEEVESTGYAIPISDAIPILTELMNREEIDEKDAGYLGISGATVTTSYSQRFGIPVGVYVNKVKRNSPADKAGLVEGDVIVAYNGVAVSTNEDLQNLLDCTRAGTTVTLTVSSLEKNHYVEREVEVTLGKR